jgi:GTP-binding protein
MFLLVNNGPFSGNEGRAIMLRQLKDRLQREVLTNVALRVDDIGRADGVKVSGRGELHLAILIEEMRREGIELCVSRPEVITSLGTDGAVLEPMEQLIIDVPEEYQGVVMEKLARRKGELVHVENTDTRGLGIMASRFTGYGPWKGEILSRFFGSLVSMETGPVTSYQMEKLQERAALFVQPMQLVYRGQIVGENSRPDDLPCNPTKCKALTNHRASNKDQSAVLNTPRLMTLEQALEWIAWDELVEVTPKSIRMRKAILDADERKRIDKRRQTSRQNA